jgi:nickel superoxide dismutase
MRRKLFSSIIAGLILFVAATTASAHCEIPCGIYDDQLRLDLIAEHTKTIEKSMNKITGLSKGGMVNYNQLVRWISNKEHHANEIQHIVSRYFMTQRIKPTADKYVEKLKLLHGMLIYAMKCKQTTDPGHVEKLRSLLKEFGTLYHGHQ